MATEWERLWPTKVHRARICLWRDLSMQQLEVIGKAQTGEELKRVLAELFSLTWAEIDQRSAILLELYYYTVLFCREQGFSDAQTSCLFSIIKETHEFCIETPLGNIEQCYNYFTELLLCHTVRVRLDISLSYCGLSESKIQLKRNVSVEPGFDDSSSPREKEQATAVAEEAAEEDESPMAPLKNYIKAQLALEVSQLLSIVEEKLLASEHNFSSKLALLEEPSSTKKSHGGSKGKRK
ncbi:cilia- and flagella-associated protein 119 isoform X3 [Microcaecilia unicolor]|uniref:Coiled-coil domain-containing protein 189 isoform X3 n=1 Tax=Microcaecilia unicolor TaxID=1415580 RepID=A0A6P7YMV7_9AMPH|nr:coiled-coil domain-containing protein 189 isoform X3 [Microcaecilia unicolor]